MEEQKAVMEWLAELGFDSGHIWKYIHANRDADRICSFERKYHELGYTRYQLEFQKNGHGVFEPRGYDAQLIMVPGLPHGTYNGIDTLLLEHYLRSVDWDFIQPYYNNQHPRIDQAYDAFNSLLAANTAQAILIASELCRYYMSGPGKRRPVSRGHYFKLHHDLSDFDAKQAYNLLCGRAVVKFGAALDRPHTFIARWAVLEGEHVVYFPEFNVGEKLRALHIEEANPASGGRVLYNFFRGDRQMVHAPVKGVRTSLYIEAEPRNQSFRFYDLHGNTIDPGLITSNTAAEDQRKIEKEKTNNARQFRKQKGGPGI